jgi:hypothetical protein
MTTSLSGYMEDDLNFKVKKTNSTTKKRQKRKLKTTSKINQRQH